MPDTNQHEARIATPMVNGVRRQLIEEGPWPAIEAALDEQPELLRWLDGCEHAEWASLSGHLRFMEVLLEHFGEDGLEALGARRLVDHMTIGPLVPVLRGWIREYGNDPVALMRVAPHVWQAVTRDAGKIVLVDVPKNSVRFRLDGAPQELLETRAWLILLRGYGAELLRQSGRQGSFSVEPSGGSLSFEARWSEA